MKRFHFELEQLLRLKRWKEEEAKKALAVEIAALDNLKAKLAELHAEMRELHGGQAEEPFGEGGRAIDVPVRLGVLHYARHLGELIVSQEGKISQQGERLKQKSDLLLKAMQERKVMEKLKERRQSEHRHEVGKMAYAALDEASAGLLRRAAEKAERADETGPVVRE